LSFKRGGWVVRRGSQEGGGTDQSRKITLAGSEVAPWGGEWGEVWGMEGKRRHGISLGTVGIRNTKRYSMEEERVQGTLWTTEEFSEALGRARLLRGDNKRYGKEKLQMVPEGALP